MNVENITPRLEEISPLIDMLQEQGVLKFGVTLYYVLHLVRESFEKFPNFPEAEKSLVEMMYKSTQAHFAELGIELKFRCADESV